MAALVVDISDAVISLIKGATLNQPITITRAWVETDRRDQMKGSDPAAITVVPSTLGAYAFDLKPRVAVDWDIGVWIDKVVDTTPAQCDPMAELVEEISILCASNRQLPIGSRWAKCVKVEAKPNYDPEQILTLRLFRSVIVLTYRVTQ